jgi:elongation factor 2
MNKILEKIELTLSEKEREKSGQDLVKIVMSKWLNCGDSILEMCLIHLPSPKVAQKYRT